MSADETPKDESGGLSNEPLPGAGGGAQPPENPAHGAGDEPTKPMPESPAQPPAAAPQPGGAATPPPPPPPAAPAAAGNPAAPIPGVASGPGQPGLAIAAFVCGLISIFTSWCCIGVPLGVAAVICGILAKGEVEKRGAPSWMWITGLVLGAVSLAVFVILLIVGAANTSWNFDTSTS